MSKRHFLEFEQPIAELDAKIEELRYVQNESAVDISEEIDRLDKKSQQLTKDIYSSLSPWQVTRSVCANPGDLSATSVQARSSTAAWCGLRHRG